ncbi:MAG TPA: dTDP-4-dehydrorhamnose 3,5-epimerase [Magnetovibrio sp.]
MSVRELSLPGAVVFSTSKFVDARGSFAETFNAKVYEQAGIRENFVQDNYVVTEKAGTLRGLHFQRLPHAQAKAVRVFRGRILDVIVDVRVGSPTYGKWEGIELSAANAEQLFVPVGFAHGYLTLEDNTEVFYKVSDFYAPQSEGGIVWNDPDLAIDWPLDGRTPSLAERDEALPRLKDLQQEFRYVEPKSAGNGA